MTGLQIFYKLRSAAGVFVLLAISWLCSSNRRHINWRLVIWGMALQLVFATVVLNPMVGDFFFSGLDSGVRRLLSFSEAGADFLFQSVHAHKLEHSADGASFTTDVFVGHISPAAKNFATWILPTIIFFSALMTVLYHVGIMQWLVLGLARVMHKTMRTSGAETLSSAANIFLGQTEAPLLVKPYIRSMTNSELMAVMVGGFANTAGGVLAMYVGLLKHIPGIAGHMVVSSIVSAPASLLIAKMFLPEMEQPQTVGVMDVKIERPDANVVEALSRGAAEGVSLAINVGGMLIAFIAMVSCINFILGMVGLSLEQLFGWCFRPLAFAIGIPWQESDTVGRLLGEKLVLTELIAYIKLADITRPGRNILSPRSAVIASYALCGFGNFASVGIQIGGIGGMAPERRGDLAKMGVKAMFAGTLATMMTATIVGLFM